LARNVELLREQVLEQGYATRDASFGGRKEPIDVFDDQLAAIAVPIVHGQRVLGCINVVWLKRVDNLHAVVSRHLPLLVQTASDIAFAWGQKAL
jgi:IclR family mhp operon transcriptional activator